MREETLFKFKTPYREEIAVKGFKFGHGKKTACFVGALRGNEIQQMYIASLLIKRFTELEAAGLIEEENEFLVIPCINPFSMNIGKRFWPVDNTDINRMFPGYNLGETTQRIAAAVFENVRDYHYGIQFASFYLSGNFVPHVRIMNTGYQSPELAKEFGLPYVMLRQPSPIDTTTLNYNWQIFETDAFSIYTKETSHIDDESAMTAVNGVLRFLNSFGFIKCRPPVGFQSEIVKESEFISVSAPCGGLFRNRIKPGQEVQKGEVMATILDPLRAEEKERIIAPESGIVFFAREAAMITEHQTVYFINPSEKK
ncbi:MAG: succinylglutamate desuccinylase/aspartoacylase family protein [Treponema sp.]|nr:succinylglutamate desuccinylase/aspartoacylase family protein [Candidatus Treponema equifaecale]